jgi:hypothetical protein
MAPEFAPAYADLAKFYILLGLNEAEAPRAVMPKAREANRQALKLDQRLANAETALALVSAVYDSRRFG